MPVVIGVCGSGAGGCGDRGVNSGPTNLLVMLERGVVEPVNRQLTGRELELTLTTCYVFLQLTTGTDMHLLMVVRSLACGTEVRTHARQSPARRSCRLGVGPSVRGCRGLWV